MLCAKLILTRLSQWPCEVSFVFYSWGDMTQVVMLCWMRPLGSSRQTLLSLQYLGFSCTTSFFSQVEHKRLCGHLFLGVSSDSTLSCVISGTFLNVSEPQFPSRWNEGHSIYTSNYKGGAKRECLAQWSFQSKVTSFQPCTYFFTIPSPFSTWIPWLAELCIVYFLCFPRNTVVLTVYL